MKSLCSSTSDIVPFNNLDADNSRVRPTTENGDQQQACHDEDGNRRNQKRRKGATVNVRCPQPGTILVGYPPLLLLRELSRWLPIPAVDNPD
jgi:hypothetical protein